MKELLMEAVRVLRGTLERERTVVSGGGGRGDPIGRDYKADFFWLLKTNYKTSSCLDTSNHTGPATQVEWLGDAQKHPSQSDYPALPCDHITY